MPKNKLKKSKPQGSHQAASPKLNKKPSSQDMLGKILPQIKALFIDDFWQSCSRAASSGGFEDDFSAFIKRFLTKNDIIAWLADSCRENSSACDKQVNALFFRYLCLLVGY
jgi:hypothetical protein